ncbi:acyl-CoA oxidase [Emydomyces testavorans]|uniref:Acyl-coenzyme A oxidase n=1 Tax=Emydomyces testavorans TaxID=2070801 RepID=A0AAF0IIH5_9EURO|nr:acyl-CoA oxidase [Emydomyces testavorans]
MASRTRQTMLMAKARASASFKTFKLTCIIYKDENTVKRRREAFFRVENATGTADQSKLPQAYADLSREGAYHEGVRLGTASYIDGILHNHSFFSGLDQRYTLSNCTPYGLHYMMFIPTIEEQGTPEQAAYWLPLARSGKINGAYCQTELAHGTFVRGIETTATFDLATDEFVINSPTLTSAKFWPGAMATSCTHAILMARLIIKGKDHGVHPFMIQLRSLSDFSPVPGVELGDLGMKMGYNGTTNGYATFSDVRIPRNWLLMRHASVERDGTYNKAKHAKFAYLSMLYARATIAQGSGFKLAQAATIATRFSVVREQGAGPIGEGTGDGFEMAIISYRSQNFRLFTVISRAYAILFTSPVLEDLYTKLRHVGNENDFGSLSHYHMLLAGLKAWNTQVAADGAEDARKCCGGHGYVLTSGLPTIVAEALAPATFEGENYVMYQQVGRYLLKCLKTLKAGGKIDAHMIDLNGAFEMFRTSSEMDCCHATGKEFLDPEVQCSIFKHRMFRLLTRCNENLEIEAQKGKLSAAQAWNQHMMSIIAAARAYIEHFVLQQFVQAVSRISDPAINAALSRLRSVFALTAIVHPQSYDAISFMANSYLNRDQLTDIHSCVNACLDELLPDAIALTDAWDFTDASLCSAIGQYDGNAYETLMSWTRQIPMNKNMNERGSACKEAWERWTKLALKPTVRASL